MVSGQFPAKDLHDKELPQEMRHFSIFFYSMIHVGLVQTGGGFVIRLVIGPYASQRLSSKTLLKAALCLDVKYRSHHDLQSGVF